MLKLRLMRAVVLLACMAAFGATAVYAQVAAEMSANKVVVQSGKEVKQPADKAQPGDVIEYTVVYTNKSKGPVNDVVGLLPVPLGTEFLQESVQPKEFEVTANGTEYGKYPLKRKVTTADGSVREVVVPDSEIRGIRWTLGQLAAGEARTVSSRVRISAAVPAKK